MQYTTFVDSLGLFVSENGAYKKERKALNKHQTIKCTQGNTVAIDQIFFGWKEFFKLILEVSTVILPLRFVVHFLSSGFLLSVGVPIILLVSMLSIMWVVEKQLFEVTRGIRNGKIWLKKP